ncbi:MAG: HypC/HybG/HupF family hydrogenase formation chaperone [Nitrospirota bacterium]|nr:HypC/HybG/HupF family hydrogenase formation chaperone [Nitrospirota bacterium]
MCLGIPGQIVELSPEEPSLAIVDVGGVRRAVNIACIVDEDHPPEACLGDWVLIHVGFAMSRINETEAQRTLDLLAELGDVQAELETIRQTNTS